ncbi:uncharacterized protein LOC144448372 [Glandiceps talaboti]
MSRMEDSSTNDTVRSRSNHDPTSMLMTSADQEDISNRLSMKIDEILPNMMSTCQGGNNTESLQECIENVSRTVVTNPSAITNDDIVQQIMETLTKHIRELGDDTSSRMETGLHEILEEVRRSRHDSRHSMRIFASDSSIIVGDQGTIINHPGEDDIKSCKHEKSSCDKCDPHYQSILLNAVIGQLNDILEVILPKGNIKRVINCKDENGITSLIHAICHGNVSMVELLLRYGANPNTQSRDGGTPIHIALRNKCMETVKLLHGKGADINVIVRGFSMLHFAVLKNDISIVEYVYRSMNRDVVNGGGISVLHFATLGGNLEICKFLLDKGIFDINSRCPFDSIPPALISQHIVIKRWATPLHSAVLSCNSEIVSLLLTKRVNANAQDFSGDTPLHYAVDRGLQTIVRLLLQHGADKDIKNHGGKTPIDISKDSKHKNNFQVIECIDCPTVSGKFGLNTDVLRSSET